MAITLVAITYRSPQRVRLSFSEAVAAGAFQALRYTVDSVDALGADPAVNAALLVGDSPHVVEIALGSDLVGRGRYNVTCTAVPAAAGGSFTGSLAFEAPGKARAASPSVALHDIGAALYGVDLVWDGNDIAEGANGDLAVTSGMPNAQAAIKRNVLANGLPWDPDYGAHLRGYVDGPEPSMPEMLGSIRRSVQKDDRVTSVEVAIDTFSAGDATINVTGTLIGDSRFNVKTDVPRSG
jgi:hypothetical protein